MKGPSAAILALSVRLLTETRRIAAALGLPEDLDPDSAEVLDACESEIPASSGWQRYGVESHGCLRLIHAARHSIETGAAIAFRQCLRCTEHCSGSPDERALASASCNLSQQKRAPHDLRDPETTAQISLLGFL